MLSQVEGIDFATQHVYPHHFLGESQPWSVWLNFYVNFIKAHHEDGDVLDMPVVLAEFGIPNWVPWQRQQLFIKAYELVYESAAAGGAAAGSMYWVAYHNGSPNHGLWGVYYPGSTDIIPLIQQHAADLEALVEQEVKDGVVEGQDGPPDSNNDDGEPEGGQLAVLTSSGQLIDGFSDASWVFDSACSSCGYQYGYQGDSLYVSTGAWGAFAVRVEPGDEAGAPASLNDMGALAVAIHYCTASNVNLIRMLVSATDGTYLETQVCEA